MKAFTREKTIPIRAICALLIVAGHLAIPVGSRWLQPFLELAACSVAIFLFISGYGLAKSYTMKGAVYLDHFFHKRVWKVLWPAIVALVIWYILVPDSNRNYLHDLYMTFRHGSPPLAQLWYVIEILFFYLSFWLSYRFLPQRWRIPTLWLSAVLLIIVTFSLGYSRNWWIHALAFPTGVSYMYEEDRILTWINKKQVNPLLALAALVVLFVIFFLSGNHYLWILCYIIVPLACTLVASLLPLEKLNDPVTRFLGKASYEIYLFHGIAIAVLRGSKIFIQSDAGYIVGVYLMTLLMAALYLLAEKIPNLLRKVTSSN